MMNLFRMMDGKKTYILAFAGVVWAVVGLFMGHLSPQDAVEVMGGAFSVAALRHGVAK